MNKLFKLKISVNGWINSPVTEYVKATNELKAMEQIKRSIAYSLSSYNIDEIKQINFIN